MASAATAAAKRTKIAMRPVMPPTLAQHGATRLHEGGSRRAPPRAVRRSTRSAPRNSESSPSISTAPAARVSPTSWIRSPNWSVQKNGAAAGSGSRPRIPRAAATPSAAALVQWPGPPAASPANGSSAAAIASLRSGSTPTATRTTSHETRKRSASSIPQTRPGLFRSKAGRQRFRSQVDAVRAVSVRQQPTDSGAQHGRERRLARLEHRHLEAETTCGRSDLRPDEATADNGEPFGGGELGLQGESVGERSENVHAVGHCERQISRSGLRSRGQARPKATGFRDRSRRSARRCRG